MLKLLFSEDPVFHLNLGRWVTSRLFMTRQLRVGDYTVIGVARVNVEKEASEIIAGVLFHDYCAMGDGGKIEVSMVAEDPKWAQPGIVRAILYYPFIQMNCHVLIATTNKTNTRTRRFLNGLGFKERGIIPNRPHADDTVIYALRREDAAKWLPKTEKKVAA